MMYGLTLSELTFDDLNEMATKNLIAAFYSFLVKLTCHLTVIYVSLSLKVMRIVFSCF